MPNEFLKPRVLFWSIVSTLILLTVGFYFALFLPQQAEITALREQVAQKQQIAVRYRQFLTAHPDLDAYEKQMKQSGVHFRKLLPQNVDVSDFLSRMQLYALRAGVQVEGCVPHLPVQREGYCAQEIELNISGNYFQLLDFVQALENGERFVTVSTLTGDADGAGIATVRLHLSIYGLQL